MTDRLRAAALVAAVTAPFAIPASGATSAGTVGSTAGIVKTRLSNERTLSRWAYPSRPAVIRNQPKDGARIIGRLRLRTEDRLPNTYLLIKRRTTPDAGDWVRLRIPGRPNGRRGWVKRDALGRFHRVTTSITVDRHALTVTLRRGGRAIFRAPVGIGTAATPTPAGRFWIREKFHVRPGSLYGPRALGTSAYAPHLTDWPSGGVIGFRGTDAPWLIPGRPSHGCIRLRNDDILRFYRLVPIGTPVHII